jgi:hypothetical protein
MRATILLWCPTAVVERHPNAARQRASVSHAGHREPRHPRTVHREDITGRGTTKTRVRLLA